MRRSAFISVFAPIREILTCAAAWFMFSLCGPISTAQATESGNRDEEHWESLLAGESSERPATVEDINRLIERYQLRNIYDPVIAVFSVTAKQLPTETTVTIELNGEVSLHWYKSGLERAISSAGVEVAANNVRVLPDESLGKNKFAVATTASTTMRRFPAMDAEQVNAIPHGWPLRLLREAKASDLETSRPRRRRDRDSEYAAAPYSGKWFFAQGSEGYVGYVRDDQIGRLNSYRLPDAILTAGTTVSQTAIPAGAGLYGRDSKFSVPLRDSSIELSLRPDQYVSTDNGLTSKTIMQAAERVMNTRYIWGGVTELGIDCSGFTQYVYKMLGVYLPRDARPQSVVGQIVAFGEDVERDARAGDLVYFADTSGRISHIGISLGNGRLIHSSGGVGVHECGYDEASRSRPNGMLERVIFARRVMGKRRP